MTLSINLTRRVRRRKLKGGSAVEQVRFVLNWRDPAAAHAISGSSSASGTPRSGGRSLSRHSTGAPIAPQIDR